MGNTLLSFFAFLLYFTAVTAAGPLKNGTKLWTSGFNRRFAHMTMEEMTRLLGSRMPDTTVAVPPNQLPNDGAIPVKSFNAADNWPQCARSINLIRDQGACGSCWATASAAVLSDLTCIRCNGTVGPYLSEQDLLTCCGYCGNCEQGGVAQYAFQYWIANGIVSGGPYGTQSGCQPYTIPSQENPPPLTPACSRQCGSWYPVDYYSDKHHGQGYKPITGEDDMKTALAKYGPLVVAHFSVYADFFNYTDGIYHRTSNTLKGYHSLKIIGWGVDDGTNTPYWLVANSWGPGWGLNGFFKIIRGQNECEIEKNVLIGLSAVDSCFDSNHPYTGATSAPASTPATGGSRPASMTASSVIGIVFLSMFLSVKRIFFR